MDGGLKILGKMCDELERKREMNREERGKGKNRASSGGRRVYVGRSLAPVRVTNQY